MTGICLQPPSRKIVVFSGGSAANSLVDMFDNVINNNACTLSYVIPISDNGGSSSELIRVFGGPGIGDIRSRLVRLIPESNAPILAFFNHRLPLDPDLASVEFSTLLTGTSSLYHPIPTPQALLIRSILSHLHLEILKRARPPSSTFNFQSASIGNLFLTGARFFSGSFEAAIYLLALIGRVDESRTAVLPAVVSNFTHHISAGLADGSVITGQNAISHPSAPTALHPSLVVDDPSNSTPSLPLLDDPGTGIEDAHLPGSLPNLRLPYISFSKTEDEPLPARISRIWYINPYGQEMFPVANPTVLSAIHAAEAVIYSIGSLYTSIAPSLILRGVGDAITSGPRVKILLLNGSLDRETPGFTARDFVAAIARAGEQSRGLASCSSTNDADIDPATWSRYVTHLIHLEGEGAPAADREEMTKYGIKCVRLYGRKAGETTAAAVAGGGGGGMRYDGKALEQALGAILGRRDPKEGRSRRNTAEK